MYVTKITLEISRNQFIMQIATHFFSNVYIINFIQVTIDNTLCFPVFLVEAFVIWSLLVIYILLLDFTVAFCHTIDNKLVFDKNQGQGVILCMT